MTPVNLPMKQTHRRGEQTCGSQGGVGKGEGWTERLRLIEANYYSYSAENCSIQPSGIKHNGKNIFKKNIYTDLSHFAVQQKLAKRCESTILK